MIGRKDLGELYDSLLGLGMMTVDDILKWFGQYPKSIPVLAILMTLLMQSSSFRIDLRCLYDSLSRPGVDKLLHVSNAILNSFLEKGVVMIWRCGQTLGLGLGQSKDIVVVIISL